MEYSGQIGFTITEQSEQQVTAEMPIQSGIINPFGTVHAGAILWFADVTASMLAVQGKPLEPGMQGFPLLINLSANLLSNQTGGVLLAHATYVKRGKSISIVKTLVTGQGERLIAEVTTNQLASR